MLGYVGRGGDIFLVCFKASSMFLGSFFIIVFDLCVGVNGVIVMVLDLF